MRRRRRQQDDGMWTESPSLKDHQSQENSTIERTRELDENNQEKSLVKHVENIIHRQAKIDYLDIKAQQNVQTHDSNKGYNQEYQMIKICEKTVDNQYGLYNGKDLRLKPF